MGQAAFEPSARPTAELAPIGSGERIDVIDILRGFALFGILLVNFPLFGSPLALQISETRWWTAPLDRGIETAIQFFAQGKFYTLFSLLFGLGLAIQIERAAARGVRPGAFVARRLLWLLLIGLIHAFLIWMGDILVIYAVVGLLVLPFRNRSRKTLLAWTLILLAIPPLLTAGMTGAVELGRHFPEAREEIETAFAEAETGYAESIAQAREVYAEGSYAEVTRVRASEVLMIYRFSIFFTPTVLALFLIGLSLGQRGFFRDLPDRVPFLRRVLPWLLGVGLLGNAIGVVAYGLAPSPSQPSWPLMLSQLGFAVGAPALSFGYAAVICLLVQRPVWRRRLGLLAAPGRMALTNYLMHSLIGTALFYSYGLGFYGRLPPSVTLPLTFLVFGFQIPLSHWWLTRFRFGPAEWLWRSLTYLRPQPMRISA